MNDGTSPAFRKAQWRFLIASMFAYSAYYVTRKNLSIAQPMMLEEGVVTTYALGTMITVNGVLYGLSRFVNGLFGDRFNGRIFMSVGLLLSAGVSFAFGCASSAALFATLWIVNGWTQGMGSPATARMLTRWIHPRDFATKTAIWNISHNVGAVGALAICTALVAAGFGWRWCFWVPAAVTGLGALFTWFCVKDRPEEAGLEELTLEVKAAAGGRQLAFRDRLRLVFCNRVIWLVAIANFFVYIVRFGFLDWGPTFLKDCKGIPVTKGGLMIIGFELAAVVGTLFVGWITDKLFGGRGARTCAFCMLFASLCAFGFWMLPHGAPTWASTALLMGAGFFIYGPQSLIGAIVMNQATREAASIATGFTGMTGYAATIVSGIGIAVIKEHFGWDVTLFAIAGFALLGMLLCLCVWTAPADGYAKK